MLALLASRAETAARVRVTLTSGHTPRYGTLEIVFDAPRVPGNKFTKFASVTFSRGGRNFAVEGFHDGDDTWRARFMPDEEGSWDYAWSFRGETGGGSFLCTPRANPKAHGHVRRDPAHPRYLVCDDGNAHYWHGGKWISAANYGPPNKGGEANGEHVADGQFISYLDTCEQLRHNGLLIKTALYALENDKFSWDLTWIRRGEWLVQEMAARGIYCQVNFFDTWARDRNSRFSYSTSGDQHLLNVWAPGDEDAKENYIRYLVARYAGFYNVCWELGNEMEHSPNSGSAFVAQANSKYVPWIRQYDPYDLPIGLSENIWKSADVDIGFLHQTGALPALTTNGNRPNIMNELVSPQQMWKDSAIRDAGRRLDYRRTFWRMFTYGGTGSSEATWLDITTPLNQAVLDVMGDQKRLRDFVDALPTHINEMITTTDFVVSGPCHTIHRSRVKQGECYVCYFLGNADAGTLTVDLPAGDYVARWYHPSTGQYEGEAVFSHKGGHRTLGHPAFSEDLALTIVSSGAGTVSGDGDMSEPTDLIDAGAPTDSLLGREPIVGRRQRICDKVWQSSADETTCAGQVVTRPEPSLIEDAGSVVVCLPTCLGTAAKGAREDLLRG